jgi:hypothetical protein
VAHDLAVVAAACPHQGPRGAVHLLAHPGAGPRGLDPDTAKLLDSARGDKPGADGPRRLKPGTVLVREYQGERHTVTVIPGGYVWREATYASTGV